VSYPARPNTGYPTDLAGRQVRRTRIRRGILAEAEARIARAGRSLTCGEYRTHTTCSGAGNCLCECHDPREDT
jgi:hypothetical protein